VPRLRLRLRPRGRDIIVDRTDLEFTDGGGPRAPRGADAGPPPPGLGSLTGREREVVALVAAGLSNDEIARQLVVSPLTAKTHVSRAMTKLNARDRAQLVFLAYEHGLTAS